MHDLTQNCTNCQSEFVIPVDEQKYFTIIKLPLPTLCPICRSIKQQEKRTTPKPPKPTSVS